MCNHILDARHRPAPLRRDDEGVALLLLAVGSRETKPLSLDNMQPLERRRPLFLREQVAALRRRANELGRVTSF